MDRERYDREMAAYNQLHEKQNGNGQALFTTTPPKTMLINFSKPKEPNDDVYRVTYEDGSKNLVAPDESALRLAIEAMENAESNESIFRIDWDNNAASWMKYEGEALLLWFWPFVWIEVVCSFEAVFCALTTSQMQGMYASTLLFSKVLVILIIQKMKYERDMKSVLCADI